MSEADARRRLAAQLPADEKAARADYVIDTGGTFRQHGRAGRRRSWRASRILN